MAFTATVTEAPVHRLGSSAARSREPGALPFAIPELDPSSAKPTASVATGPVARESSTAFSPVMQARSAGAGKDAPRTTVAAPSAALSNADVVNLQAPNASPILDTGAIPTSNVESSMVMPGGTASTDAPSPKVDATSAEETRPKEDVATDAVAPLPPIMGQPILNPQPVNTSPDPRGTDRAKASDGKSAAQAMAGSVPAMEEALTEATSATSEQDSQGFADAESQKAANGKSKTTADDAPASGLAALTALLPPVLADGPASQTVPQTTSPYQPAPSNLASQNPLAATTGEAIPAKAISDGRAAARLAQAEETPAGKAVKSGSADSATATFSLDADASGLLAQTAVPPPTTPTAHAATAEIPAQATQVSAPPSVPLGAVPMTIGLRALSGSNTFEIRLDPKDLGRIEVNLAIDKETGAVQASLVVDRPETLALLQRDAGNLQQALAQAGLDAPDGSVTVSLRNDGAGNEGAGGDPSGGAGTQGREPGGQNQQRRPDTHELPNTLSAVPLRLFGAGRGLDIRI